MGSLEGTCRLDCAALTSSTKSAINGNDAPNFARSDLRDSNDLATFLRDSFIAEVLIFLSVMCKGFGNSLDLFNSSDEFIIFPRKN